MCASIFSTTTTTKKYILSNMWLPLSMQNFWNALPAYKIFRYRADRENENKIKKKLIHLNCKSIALK